MATQTVTLHNKPAVQHSPSGLSWVHENLSVCVCQYAECARLEANVLVLLIGSVTACV